jgi:hypothetical protein
LAAAGIIVIVSGEQHRIWSTIWNMKISNKLRMQSKHIKGTFQPSAFTHAVNTLRQVSRPSLLRDAVQTRYK